MRESFPGGAQIQVAEILKVNFHWLVDLHYPIFLLCFRPSFTISSVDSQALALPLITDKLSSGLYSLLLPAVLSLFFGGAIYPHGPPQSFLR